MQLFQPKLHNIPVYKHIKDASHTYQQEYFFNMIRLQKTQPRALRCIRSHGFPRRPNP
jgi:hypothetical protein